MATPAPCGGLDADARVGSVNPVFNMFLNLRTIYDALYMKVMHLHEECGVTTGHPLMLYSLDDTQSSEQSESERLSGVCLPRLAVLQMHELKRWLQKHGETPWVECAPGGCLPGRCPLIEQMTPQLEIECEHFPCLMIHDWFLSPTVACRNLWAFLQETKDHDALYEFCMVLSLIYDSARAGTHKTAKLADSIGSVFGGAPMVLQMPLLPAASFRVPPIARCLVCGSDQIFNYDSDRADDDDFFLADATHLSAHGCDISFCSDACHETYGLFHDSFCPEVWDRAKEEWRRASGVGVVPHSTTELYSFVLPCVISHFLEA